MPVVIIGSVLLVVVVLSVFWRIIARFKEAGDTLEHSTRELLIRLQSLESRMEQNERSMNETLAGMREELRASSREGRQELTRNFLNLGENQSQHLKDIAGIQKDAFELLSSRLGELTKSNETRQDALRDALDVRLKAIQEGNEEKLEKMRVIVDEKLHATLEQRLGAAFSNVSEWLDKVHRGLGEMKTLASDVGDLRKVLTNVKTRGIWGEIQLGALLEQILQRDQYECNVAVVPDSSERVEFAVKLPGRDDDGVVWLPIDSKFPQEDYLRIVEASDRADAAAVAESRKALERRIADEAGRIHDKYIKAPFTTDFAIMFLPVEGLYAEVLRIDGLCERLIRDLRVVISGPATVAALLNSFQMGFRTLAVERRSSEVWALLGQVKTEFAKFGDVLDKARKRIELAGKDLDTAGVRTRAIERRLRDVTELSSGELSAGTDLSEELTDEAGGSDFSDLSNEDDSLP